MRGVGMKATWYGGQVWSSFREQRVGQLIISRKTMVVIPEIARQKTTAMNQATTERKPQQNLPHPKFYVRIYFTNLLEPRVLRNKGTSGCQVN